MCAWSRHDVATTTTITPQPPSSIKRAVLWDLGGEYSWRRLYFGPTWGCARTANAYKTPFHRKCYNNKNAETLPPLSLCTLLAIYSAARPATWYGCVSSSSDAHHTHERHAPCLWPAVKAPGDVYTSNCCGRCAPCFSVHSVADGWCAGKVGVYENK